MFRKLLIRRLNNRLDQATQMGAVTTEECHEIKEQVELAEIFVIFEILMLIIELIRAWRENKAGNKNL